MTDQEEDGVVLNTAARLTEQQLEVDPAAGAVTAVSLYRDDSTAGLLGHDPAPGVSSDDVDLYENLNDSTV